MSETAESEPVETEVETVTPKSPKKKPKPAKKTLASTPKTNNKGLARAENFYTLDLHYVGSNAHQSRGMGVMEHVEGLGIGLFEPAEPVKKLDDEDKEAIKDWPKVMAPVGKDGKEVECLKPIWPMLLGTEPAEWQAAVGLMGAYAPDIAQFSDRLAIGQLHNIGFVEIKDDKGRPTGKYDIVYGMRRCLAKAFMHARSVGEVPATLKAEMATNITDPYDLAFRALAENNERKNESFLDRGLRYAVLRKMGMTILQIAQREGEEHGQNVRNCLQLLRCTPEEQQRVHAGKLGLVKALDAMKKRQDAAANGTTAGEAGEAKDKPVNRKRVPTLKYATTAYAAVEKPKIGGEEISDEEWGFWQNDACRKMWSLFLDTPFVTFKDLKKQKADAEKKALQEEEARRAAAAAEEGEGE